MNLLPPIWNLYNHYLTNLSLKRCIALGKNENLCRSVHLNDGTILPDLLKCISEFKGWELSKQIRSSLANKGFSYISSSSLTLIPMLLLTALVILQSFSIFLLVRLLNHTMLEKIITYCVTLRYNKNRISRQNEKKELT